MVDMTSESFGKVNCKAAATIELRQQNTSNLSEKPLPFSNEPLSHEDAESSQLIALSCFPDFVEPRLKYE